VNDLCQISSKKTNHLHHVETKRGDVRRKSARQQQQNENVETGNDRAEERDGCVFFLSLHSSFLYSFFSWESWREIDRLILVFFLLCVLCFAVWLTSSSFSLSFKRAPLWWIFRIMFSWRRRRRDARRVNHSPGRAGA
jgi:hypothetical protein